MVSFERAFFASIVLIYSTSTALGEPVLTYNGVTVDLRKFPSENGYTLNLINGNNTYYMGVIGGTLNSTYNVTKANNQAILDFDDEIHPVSLRLTIKVNAENWLVKFNWISSPRKRFEDCFLLEPYNWFGGPELKNQFWPTERVTLKEFSFVTKEEENHAVIEPYWINSAGTFLYVDKEVPLFIDQNNLRDKHLCFISHVKEPYSARRDFSSLIYDVVFNEGAREGHEFAVREYLGKPSAVPDFDTVRYPIFSTWARYARPINETTVVEFADQILAHGFSNRSVVEIDDLWEVCYGSLQVDARKFPDMRRLVADLKARGFRVTLWIHPFINENCQPWHGEAAARDYLIKTENGSIFTSWWNNNGSRASHFDFTNPEARAWWAEQVALLKSEYGFDSFKFDAGESGWMPQIPVQRGNIDLHPGLLTIDYLNTVAQFGPMIEVRSGLRTQNLPVFVRMVDKNSQWSETNGLPTIVTTLLQMNMNGYPFVIPDMIGGNGANLNETDVPPTKELYIRWLQANTFMPVLQFSFIPWQFDGETIEIALKYTQLHERYADVIQARMELAVSEGLPVNPPIWWNDDEDLTAMTIGDEYLLGDDILVAPVLKEGARERDIYLPTGFWQDGVDERFIYRGRNWYRNFSVPLDTLQYFIRVQQDDIDFASMEIVDVFDM